MYKQLFNNVPNYVCTSPNKLYVNNPQIITITIILTGLSNNLYFLPKYINTAM